MANEFENSLFEDNSTVHFGGDGNEEMDLFAGFDDEAPVATGEPEQAVTIDQPETGTEGSEEIQEAPTTEPEEEPPAPDTSNKLTFKAKIDHQEQDISIGEEELPALYQKASNMDRAVQRAEAAQQEAQASKDYVNKMAGFARSLGFEGDTAEAVIDAMIQGAGENYRNGKVAELVQNGTAQEVAEFVVDQQMKDAAQASPVAQNTDSANEEIPASDGTPTPEKFAGDLQSLLALRPELRNSETPFPDEVLRSYMEGRDLTVAYLDYEAKKIAAEKQKLEDQNRVLKQNEGSAKRAPVRGVTGSGNTGGQEDSWLNGFDDPLW